MRIALLRYAACFLFFCIPACERDVQIATSSQDSSGLYDLHFAVRDQDIELARTLLEGGADPNQPFAPEERAANTPAVIFKFGQQIYTGDTPISVAVRGGNTAMVELLSEYGADFSVRDEDYYGNSLLHFAADADDAAMIKCLIRHGMDPNVGLPTPGPNEPPGIGGRTPLMTAANFDSLSAINALLDNGADINARSATNATAMHAVASVTKPAAAKLLIKRGADLNLVENQTGATPLHFAADDGASHTGTNEGRADMVRLLVEAGANINKPDARGRTPLYRAVESGCIETARVLLELGADPLAKPQEGLWRKSLESPDEEADAEFLELLKKHLEEEE